MIQVYQKGRMLILSDTMQPRPRFPSLSKRKDANSQLDGEGMPGVGKFIKKEGC